MAIGSGLSGQLGLKAETTWGTAVVPDKFYEFNSASLAWEPTWVEGQGLRAGATYKRDTRTQQTRFGVTGDIAMEYVNKGGLGLLWKHALGSAITTPTAIGLSTAYEQHHFPLSKQGLGLSIQVGKPQPDGIVKPHTFQGCKISSWEFSVADGDKATITFTFDGQDEQLATALAAASYPVGLETFTFKDANSFQLGGTVALSSNAFTWTGGTAPSAIVRSFTIRGETPMATERYGLGNSGGKSEQIENDIPTITGTLEAEYIQDDYYSIFKSADSTSMQLVMQRGDAGGDGTPFELAFTMPKVKFKSVPTSVDGPDIISSSVEFEAYHDDSISGFTSPFSGSSTALEVKVVSTDTTLAG